MEVRLIKKDELLQSEKISAVAFEFSTNLEIDPDRDVNVDGGSLTYGAFENGRMMGQIIVIPHKVYFNGHIVESAGIGGVSTLPEFRHKKCIRRIFETAFEDMKSKKQYISQLYPFSYAYYGKFGYETAYERLHLKVEFENLKQFERNNKCVLIEEHTNKDLRTVYEKYASWHNGAYNRNDTLWDIVLSKNIYNKRHYPYVYYNDNGEPSGYFIYTRDGETFKLMEIGYDNRDSLTGMLGFMRNFEADYSNIVTNNLPVSEDFSILFINQYDIERKCEFASMTRIVDVQKIFELMKYPADSGNFSISVRDEFQPFNSGVYRIAYKDGKLTDIEHTANEKESSVSADIETDVRALAKLVYGVDDLLSYRYQFLDGFKINGNIETLKKVFIKRHIYLGDNF